MLMLEIPADLDKFDVQIWYAENYITTSKNFEYVVPINLFYDQIQTNIEQFAVFRLVSETKNEDLSGLS